MEGLWPLHDTVVRIFWLTLHKQMRCKGFYHAAANALSPTKGVGLPSVTCGLSQSQTFKVAGCANNNDHEGPQANSLRLVSTPRALIRNISQIYWLFMTSGMLPLLWYLEERHLFLCRFAGAAHHVTILGNLKPIATVHSPRPSRLMEAS